MKMIALFKNKTMNIVMAAAILITCVLSGSITTYADELPEPYPHWEVGRERMVSVLGKV